MIYADHAATTQLSPLARETMLTAMDRFWANPSSLHTPGQEAAEALQQARATVAAAIGAAPSEIYFTSGGSEADNQAIRSAALAGAKRGKRHLISTQIEHHAVLHTLRRLEGEGFSVTLVGVGPTGIVDPADIAAAIREDTALVTVMFANNEIGTIQPIAQIGQLCRAHKIPFHTDAVQAAGHLDIDVAALQVDMLSLSGHKFRGPKGVGALYVRRGLPLHPLIEGGSQERGRRAGTENLPAILAMAAALEEACAHREETARRLISLRDKLIAGLATIPASRLNGHPTQRLPGNVNMCFEGIEGESLLLLLDARGIAASSGSACTSGSLDPSHVLLALGLPHEIAHGSLRLSLGEENTEADINAIIQGVTQVVGYLRDISPVWEAREKGELRYAV